MDYLYDKYLNLLGIRRRAPGPDALKELVRAHTATIPFENISKLLYRNRPGQSRLVSLDQYLEGVERYHFGGTCYANNYYFNRLLTWLGYVVKLCGADMTEPDVHVVNVVNFVNDVNDLNGVNDVNSVNGVNENRREFLVDMGYAAPFREPIPLDLATDYMITMGTTRYVLKPGDGRGRHRMELYRNGELAHGYLINPLPREISEFEQTIGNSFRTEATFMNNLLITRFEGDRFLSLRNMTLTESTPETSALLTLGSREEVAAVIEKRFGIHQEIVLESIEGITLEEASGI